MGKKIKIDATDVNPEVRKSGGRTHVPEGEYAVKINSGELLNNSDNTSRYIRWEAIITEPRAYRGKSLRGITSLKKEALWSLRNLIHAATGKNIAGRVVNFDPETIYGKVVGASVSDNVFKGKDGVERVSSQIDSFFPKDEINFAEDDDTDEADDDEEEVEEEEEEDEDEELEDVEVDEL
jgi:hypothetical protein